LKVCRPGIGVCPCVLSGNHNKLIDIKCVFITKTAVFK
jgi:hypothetical protein